MDESRSGTNHGNKQSWYSVMGSVSLISMNLSYQGSVSAGRKNKLDSEFTFQDMSSMSLS
jgi:hypothetical protein